MALISSGVIQFFSVPQNDKFIYCYTLFQLKASDFNPRILLVKKRGVKYFKSIQNVCSGHQIRLKLWTTVGW